MCVCVCVLQELVKLTIEKHEQPSPTSPSKPMPPVTKTERYGLDLFIFMCTNHTWSRC